MSDVIGVTALNQYVKTLLDTDDALYDIALRGEVANFVRNAKSGHCYFTLRDETSSVKAVMFSREASRLVFRPEDGMRVVVRCRVSLYVQSGSFQLYVTDIFPDGIGSAQLALEQLKQKLYAEGLFDESCKRPLPASPRYVAVVTSKTGAALQDICNVLSRRWPMVKLLLCPVTVQGFAAAEQVAAAIDRLAADGRADVILVARGGGSKEDLWVFNAECIARAAFRCPIPIISAIGHEIDVTILDYVADRRAPTPSAAAELAVPDQKVIYAELCMKAENMRENMQTRMALCYNSFAEMASLFADNPCRKNLEYKQRKLKYLRYKAPAVAKDKLSACQRQLGHATAMANSLSPHHTLARGYTVLCDKKGNYADMASLSPGDHIRVIGSNRTANCLVETIREDRNETTQKL